MIEIIKKGLSVTDRDEKAHKITCLNCYTKFSYQGKDTYYYARRGQRLVQCPECKNIINTGLKYMGGKSIER